MLHRVEIENIEEMRRQQGIDDVELAEAIRHLKVGDIVNLTFLTKARSFDTAPVRITQISGMAFRGKLVKPASALGQGKIVEFTVSHIHSVVTTLTKYASSSSLS